MRTLTAADVRLGLDNLFTSPVRLDLFKQTAAYLIYGAALDSVRIELPFTVKGNRPLAKDLKVADQFHDDLGSALFLLTDSIKTHPSISPLLKQKAERVQTHFIPNLGVLQAKYKREVESAKANRNHAIELKAELESIPTPDGRTAHDWVVEFLDSGDKLGQLIDARSAVQADEPGPEVLLARTRALTMLTKARHLVAEEAKETSKLPKNAEAIIFGYFDTLAEFRSNAKNDTDEAPPAPLSPETSKDHTNG